jgi:hypothetical protein
MSGKSLWMMAQHTKPSRGDHGLNRIGDGIVIGLQSAGKTASGSLK